MPCCSTRVWDVWSLHMRLSESLFHWWTQILQIPTGSRPFHNYRRRLWLQIIKDAGWNEDTIKNVCILHNNYILLLWSMFTMSLRWLNLANLLWGRSFVDCRMLAFIRICYLANVLLATACVTYVWSIVFAVFLQIFVKKVVVKEEAVIKKKMRKNTLTSGECRTAVGQHYLVKISASHNNCSERKYATLDMSLVFDWGGFQVSRQNSLSVSLYLMFYTRPLII